MAILSVLLFFSNIATVSADDRDENVPDPELYTAHYEFELKGSDEELPEEVLSLLPEDLSGLEDGDEVEALPMEDVTVGETVYVFVCWTPERTVIDGEDAVFVGTWEKKTAEPETFPDPAKEDPVVQEEEKEDQIKETYSVEYVFLKYGTFLADGLPNEVMDLLPEKKQIPVGEEPDLPEFGITAGFQFRGWDKAGISYDDGTTRTICYGFWEKLMFRVIPVSGNPGYPGAAHVITGGPAGVPGSAVPTYSLNGHSAYCVRPDITGYPVTGTSYYRGGTYGSASSTLPERVANIMITGQRRGASPATIQAAVWDALGSNHGVSWRSLYDDSITAWGEVWESYLDPGTGLPMQDLGYATGYRSNSGKLKVLKKQASSSYDYVKRSPNNYSLKDAVYEVFTDPNCTGKVGTLTTGADGNTTELDLSPGTYYVKEKTASKGFALDETVHSVTLSAGKTSTVTSEERPLNDVLNLILYKRDKRNSGFSAFLDEAEFTLKYYDAQTDDPSDTPGFTWTFRTSFDSQGKAVLAFDEEHYVSGDPIDGWKDPSGKLFLPLGTFTIEETKAPRLFARDENVYVGHVCMIDGQITHEIGGGQMLEVSGDTLIQSEELQTVSLVIQKVDAESGKAELPDQGITDTATLEGAQFHIWRIGQYDIDGSNLQIKEIDPIDYGTVTTDDHGKAQLKYEPGTGDGLLPGRFRVIEEKAPDGFAVNETVFTIDAPVGSEDAATFEYVLEVPDRLTRIQIEKLDQNGEPLPGSAEAILQLVESASGKVVYEFQADGTPHIIKGLTSLTEYHIHEKSVDPIYKLSEDRNVHPIDTEDGTLHDPSDPEHSYSNFYRIVDAKIEIHTTASFDRSTKREWETLSDSVHVADGVAKILDKVSYKNIYAGDRYVLEGELWDRTENRPLDNVVRKEFVPRYDTGIETLEFSQDLDGLGGHDIVVFETLYHVVVKEDGSIEEVLCAQHRDLDDTDQTVHVNELYRAVMVMYKTDAFRPIRLDGAIFSVSAKRVRRDGTVVEKDLGRYVTGGIFHEEDEPFTFLLSRNEDMSEVIRTIESSEHEKLKTQYIQVNDLEEGLYYGQVSGQEEIIRYFVGKGMIYLFDQEEDTEITYHEEIAPGGYHLPEEDFTVSVGHDYTLSRLENERPNRAIIDRHVIPKTGI